jgi:hypothetical protein
MGITVNLLHAKEWDKFSEFVRETYGESSILLNRAYVDWWFNPHREEHFRILVAREGDIFVGMNGHVQNVLENGTERIKMHWLINTMVRPGYRWGLGLGLQKKSIEVFGELGAISFTESAGQLHDFTGFRTYDGRMMERAYTTFDRLSLSDRTRLVKLDAFSLQTVEELWGRVKTRYGIATARTASFLDWRYLQHPAAHYLLFGIERKGRMDAFIVCRIDGSSYCALRIIDLFGEEEVIPGLLKAIIGYFSGKNLQFIDFYCTQTPDKYCFQEAGFKWLSEEEKTERPFLLNPLDNTRIFRENVALNFTVNGSFPSWEEIYFVKGDSDRDRPQ